MQPASQPLLHAAPHVALPPEQPQVASQDDPPSEGVAANADLSAAHAINISPRAKIVFLLAVMFFSCWDCQRGVSRPRKAS
jgi:hypothetical protein